MQREPEPGEAPAELVAEVARFVRTIDGARADREARFPEGLLAKAGALGLFALTVPTTHGGLGLSLAGACQVVEAIAKVDRSFAITVGLHAGLGTRGLIAHGKSALRDAWLPGVARGETITAFAATEPGAGSDLTRMATVLRRGHAEGYVLDGEKAYVTNGGFAGLFTVLASSPGIGAERGHTLVCVPADAPGVVVGREESKLGIRASSTVSVRFDGVRVGADQILGEPGQGMHLAHSVLAWGRTLMAGGCVGTARAALAATLTHVTSRRQSGRAIGEFGASREHVVSMACDVAAMAAVVERAARSSHDRDSLVAKVFASERAFSVCDRAVQLHGALGFLAPIGVERMLRDCRVTRIFEGANDVLLVRLGASRVASAEPLALQVSAACTGAAARLDAVVGVLRARHGVHLVKRQTTLQRVARAEIAIAAADASLAHAQGARALVALAVADRLDEAGAVVDELETDDEDRAREVFALSEGLYAQGANEKEHSPREQEVTA